MIKLTDLLIGLVFVCAFAGIFGIYMSNMSNSYGTEFNESDMSKFNKLDEVYNMTEDIKNSESNISTSSSVTDLLGDMFNKGYQSITIVRESMGIMTEMASDGINELGVEGADIWINAIAIALIILIVIGVIIAIIVKVDL